MDTLMPPGSTAPDFSLPDLQAKAHSLRNYAGRIVLINFWSAECSWSARADAALLPHVEKWGEKVVWLSIACNAGESPQLLAQTAGERRLPLVLLDTDQQVSDLYHAQVTPHFFVVDAEGMLRYQGAFDDVTFRQRTPTQGYLVNAVEALLSGKPPHPAQTTPYGCAISRFG